MNYSSKGLRTRLVRGVEVGFELSLSLLSKRYGPKWYGCEHDIVAKPAKERHDLLKEVSLRLVIEDIFQ